jgi:hypothetical protein
MILFGCLYKAESSTSDANANDEMLNFMSIKNSLDYQQIELAPYEKRLGQIYLSNPVFKREINIIY